MQIPMLADDLRAGPQHQMKSVAQDDLGPRIPQFLRGHGLDRTVGTHGHEGWGLDSTAIERQFAAPRQPVSRKDAEFHTASVSP